MSKADSRAVGSAFVADAFGLVDTSNRWLRIRSALLDLGLVGLAAWAALQSPLAHHFAAHGRSDGLGAYIAFVVLYGSLVVLCFHLCGLYTWCQHSPVAQKLGAITTAVVLATLLILSFLLLSRADVVPPSIVGLNALLTLGLVTTVRVVEQKVSENRIRSGQTVRNVAIVGSGRLARRLARSLEADERSGYRVKGFIDDDPDNDLPMLGPIQDLDRISKAEFLDEVFIALPGKREVVERVASEARSRRLNVNVVPDVCDTIASRIAVTYVGDFPVMALHREPIPAFALSIKRGLDLVLAGIAIVLTLPLMAAIAVAIRLDSPGPALYRSFRLGKKGRKFVFYKFRTMTTDADRLKDALRVHNERNGPFFKIANDPRITPVGKFLRRSSLDELPQLFNVIRGDMSLVGPRPHPVDDCAQYCLEHLRRLEITPGITGLWQVTARWDPSFETNVALDLYYIENWSLWLDFKILLKTIPAVLSGSGQ
ncbi:MAG TPA: sugar transferase [Terriglobales bacterium]|nr:sugar transferase [Terriglobales bacterium]